MTSVDESRKGLQHRWPAFLPDGHHFLYLVHGADGASDIWVGSLESGAVKGLVASETNAIYASGYLLFTREGPWCGNGSTYRVWP